MGRAWIVFILVIGMSMNFVHAAVPTIINYSGVLSDSSGNALNGSYSATFTLYNDASGSIWTENHTLNVDEGLFNVKLGSVTRLGEELFEYPLELGIAIGGDAEMTPRFELGSVPTAFASDRTVGCTQNGETNCDGACIDLQANDFNCGSCGNACNTAGGEACVTALCVVDSDGDGYYSNVDCDDSDSSAYPGAPEYCDFVDNNCDGTVDEVIEPEIWSSPEPSNIVALYVDSDGDGYPATAYGYYAGSGTDQLFSTIHCAGNLPSGTGYMTESEALAALPGDCNDSDPNYYWGAPEICDGIDQGCDNEYPGPKDNGACELGSPCSYSGDCSTGYCNPATYQCEESP